MTERERFEACARQMNRNLDVRWDGTHEPYLYEIATDIWKGSLKTEWAIWQARAALDAKVIEAADRMREVVECWADVSGVVDAACKCQACTAARAYDAARGEGKL